MNKSSNLLFQEKNRVLSEEEPMRDTKYFCMKYGIEYITVWRWERDGILPPPIKINGRKYWPPGTEPKADND